jgi:hypothetical protein
VLWHDRQPVTESFNALTRQPLFWSATLNDPGRPTWFGVAPSSLRLPSGFEGGSNSGARESGVARIESVRLRHASAICFQQIAGALSFIAFVRACIQPRRYETKTVS